jgi:segregation and condensation protein B
LQIRSFIDEMDAMQTDSSDNPKEDPQDPQATDAELAPADGEPSTPPQEPAAAEPANDPEATPAPEPAPEPSAEQVEPVEQADPTTPSEMLAEPDQPADLSDDTAAEQPDGLVQESAEDLATDPSVDPHIDLGLLEAYLFSTHSPLTAGRLAEMFNLESTKPIRKALRILNEQYEQTRRCFRVEQVAGGFQLLTLPEYGEGLKALLKKEEDSKLTKAALETLAIIAYKQPVLRAELEAIRGVASGETIRSLMEKHLVKIAGRAEEPGRPILYGTTKRFLEVFGLNSLKDLPQPEALQARAQQLAAAARRLAEPEQSPAEQLAGGQPAVEPPAAEQTTAEASAEPEAAQDVLGPGTNDETLASPESRGEATPADEQPGDDRPTSDDERETLPVAEGEPAAEPTDIELDSAEHAPDDVPSEDEGQPAASDESEPQKSP